MGSLLLLILVFGSIFVPVWLRRHPVAGLAIPAVWVALAVIDKAIERSGGDMQGFGALVALYAAVLSTIPWLLVFVAHRLPPRETDRHQAEPGSRQGPPT
jgi:hypothetical protein